MNEPDDQELKACPRCQTGNRREHNFCWLCGVPMHGHALPPHAIPPQHHQEDVTDNTAAGTVSTSTSVASTLGGLLAGAFGGIVIGVGIMGVLIMSVLNAIGEFLDGCAGTAMILSLALLSTIYSIIAWLF